eukprot:TRINITY_DN5162_c0_g1_i1.p1 TRINITY_DN5162_c0_g1~~TRINITY_DN5162_c0_g1_i1.p1  ORF type:complete len:820 (+),score=190.98 TRINITY_DN5162_c0_g1_i1:120-2579(+)
MQMPLAKQNLRPGMPMPYQIITSTNYNLEKANLLEIKSNARSLSVEKDDLLKDIDVPKDFMELLSMLSDNTPVEALYSFKYNSSFIYCFKDIITLPDHLSHFIKIFRENDSDQKVKAMYCFVENWDTDFFADYLITILKDAQEKSDIKSITDLYCIAYILSFEIPNSVNSSNPSGYATDIFPYAPAYSRIVTDKFGEKIELFIRSVVITYYIRIIHNILSMNKAGSIKRVKPVITDCNTVHQQIIINSFDSFLKDFLDVTVWKMITSPSSKICSLGLFLWLQFMASKVKTISDYMENYNCLPSIFSAFHVTHTHSRWVISHIIKFFIENQHTYYAYITKMYGEQWIEDILNLDEKIESRKKASFARKMALMIIDFEFFKKNPHLNVNIKKIIKNVPDNMGIVLSNRSMKRLINHIRYNQTKKRDKSIAKVLLSMFYTISISEKHFMMLFGRTSIPKESIVKRITNMKKVKSISFKTIKGKSMTISQRLSLHSVVPKEKQFLNLPFDLIARIFTHVDGEDLFVLPLVCKTFLVIVEENKYNFWKKGYLSLSSIVINNETGGDDKLDWKEMLKQKARFKKIDILGDFFDCVQSKIVNEDDVQVCKEIKLNMMKCARFALKTSTFFELFRQSNIFDFRIIQILSDPSIPSVNKECWRLFYQLISYHSGFTTELVKKGFVKNVLNIINEKTDPTIIFNGLYYIIKLMENPERKNNDSIRPKRKDVKTFVSFFKKNDFFENFYKIFLFIKQSNFITNLFPVIARFFKVICTSYLTQSLKKRLFKNKDYQEASNFMYEFFKIKKKPEITVLYGKKEFPVFVIKSI